MSKELKAIHNRFGDSDIRWYNADDVDALLAEKDKEIARLDDLAHAHNIELLRKENMIAEKDAEIARLKGDLKDSWDDRADSLKMLVEKDKEIESLKASHYAEMVDAGMRERRLRRELYKACANWAKAKQRRSYGLGWADWVIWAKMKRKCRAKAEEYK